MIYVYAICDDGSLGAREVRGIGEQRLHVHASHRIGAVYSETSEGALRPTAENVWRHERVIESFMEDRTVLPARFGTVVSDLPALDELVYSNRDRLIVGLDRVRECVELGLRVLAQPAGQAPNPPTHEATGRSYLLARMEHERARRRTEAEAGELAARLHERLTAAADAATLRVLPTPQFLMTAAYLVRREAIEAFRRQVVDAGAERPSLRLLCTGPWPPYHFVPELVLPAVQHA